MPQPFHDIHFPSPEQVCTASWAHDIVARLPADAVQQAIASKAFQRARQIRCPEDLLRGILAYVLSTYSLRADALLGAADRSGRHVRSSLGQTSPAG